MRKQAQHPVIQDNQRQTAEINAVRQWYLAVLSQLLNCAYGESKGNARFQTQLKDFRLLLGVEQDAVSPSDEPLDIKALAEQSITQAKAYLGTACEAEVRLSLQASMPLAWHGDGEALGALLRNLMLIALRRTHAGAVLLRLEADNAPSLQGRHWLRIKLEDSGPPLQRWQLRQWLGGTNAQAYALPHDTDVAWMLSGRLFRYLGGDASAESGPDGGLKLIGWIPLEPADMPHVPQLNPEATSAAHASAMPHCLVLAVEARLRERERLRLLMREQGCMVFFVNRHQQAVEWALALPLSAIILNAYMNDYAADCKDRLHQLMAHGDMQTLPVWVVGEQLGEMSWQEEASVRASMLEKADAAFYWQTHEHVQREFPHSLQERIPELTQQLQALITEFLPQLEAGGDSVKLRECAHTVKSAALSLGYFHLAAAMELLEHDGENAMPPVVDPYNSVVMAQCLRFCIRDS